VVPRDFSGQAYIWAAASRRFVSTCPTQVKPGGTGIGAKASRRHVAGCGVAARISVMCVRRRCFFALGGLITINSTSRSPRDAARAFTTIGSLRGVKNEGFNIGEDVTRKRQRVPSFDRCLMQPHRYWACLVPTAWESELRRVGNFRHCGNAPGVEPSPQTLIGGRDVCESQNIHLAVGEGVAPVRFGDGRVRETEVRQVRFLSQAAVLALAALPAE